MRLGALRRGSLLAIVGRTASLVAILPFALGQGVGCKQDDDSPAAGASDSTGEIDGGSTVAADASTGGTGSTGAGLPSPYAESDDSAGEQPTMDADEVITASIAGIETFLSLRPDAVVALYDGIAVMEPGCPEDQESYEDEGSMVTYWYSEGCTTSAGVEFLGGARLESFVGEEDGAMMEVRAVGSEGSLYVANGAGAWFQLQGGIEYERTIGGGYTQTGFSVEGEVSADPGSATASALLDGSIRAQGFLYSIDAGGEKILVGSGSLSGAGLGAARAFAFSNFLLIPDECEVEPLGTVSVRDDAGFWHDIAFDAGTFALEDEEDPEFDERKCDGCGAYLAGGSLEGDACVTVAQLDSLMDWEGAPW